MENKSQLLADHLRTVHFSLLIASVVLYLGSQARQPELDGAASEAEAIANVREQLHAVSLEVEKLVTPPWALYHSADQKRFRLGFMFVSQEFTSDGLCKRRGLCPSGASHNPLNLDGTVSTPFANASKELTVTLFEAFWDFPIRYHTLRSAPERIVLTCANGNVELIRSDDAQSGTQPPDFILRLVADSKQSVSGSPTDKLNSALPDSFCKAEKVGIAEVRTDTIRRFLARAAGRANWDTSAPFDKVFPLLTRNTSTEQRDNMPAPDLARELRAKSASEAGMVELFGLKIDRQNLVTVGALALLMCQWYFWIHIVELQTSLAQTKVTDWPTGYAMLYRSASARWTSCATASVIPVLAMTANALAGRPFIRGWGVWLLVMLLPLASAVLGYLIARRAAELGGPLQAEISGSSSTGAETSPQTLSAPN